MENENLIPYNEELLRKKMNELVDATREMGAECIVAYTHKDDADIHSVLHASHGAGCAFVAAILSSWDESEAELMISEIAFLSKRIRKNRENE